LDGGIEIAVPTLGIAMAERRHPRFSVDRKGIHAKMILALEAELINISTTGVCIASKKSLKLRDNYVLSLKHEDSHIQMLCSFVWENPTVNSANSSRQLIPYYMAGMAFENLSTDKLVKLKDFMRLSGNPSKQKLSEKYKSSALRFSMQSHEKACLYYNREYVVKKISLSGMLVEIDQRLTVEQKLPMSISLPDDNKPLKFTGRIASCILISDYPSKFGIGIEFLDMPERDISRLARFLSCL
jgi:Tfp pilus assembly protein PilZ